MKINPFALERYFAKYEFSARYLLSSSDCESFSMAELVEMADEETKALWDSLRLGYTESQGHPLLREAIAGTYEHIKPQDVLVLAPEEGIYLLMLALLSDGGHVICTFPGYQSLYEVARSLGCEVSLWVPDEDRGWRFDLGWLRETLRQDTRLVVVNFPHNPTGHLPEVSWYREMVDTVREFGAYLLSDEMYRFLELGRRQPLPAGCDLYERAFSLSGLSKSFGLPGLRIGWVATAEVEILAKMAELKDYTTICSSAPAEILALVALRSRERILKEQLERLHRNAALLENFFEKRSGAFAWNRPGGGSICFPRVLMVDDTNAFCEQLVVEAGIMLAPSRVFQYGDTHVRIGFGRQDFQQVLDLFGNYLDLLP
ncbi:MAG: aminotransferase class I/II-fold pyridoxal phosphate-dependent enzyme [Anaerolineales bacterium]